MSSMNCAKLHVTPMFNHDKLEWPYSHRDGTVMLYATEELSLDEALAYINRGRALRGVKTIFVVPDGDEVMIEYCYGHRNFERIRRITGYLVGTLDRFNDGKRAEVSDRVKHGMR